MTTQCITLLTAFTVLLVAADGCDRKAADTVPPPPEVAITPDNGPAPEQPALQGECEDAESTEGACEEIAAIAQGSPCQLMAGISFYKCQGSCATGGPCSMQTRAKGSENNWIPEPKTYRYVDEQTLASTEFRCSC
ncbi:MAG: hypothetical protein JKY37_19095 [Nannocystaceae bacterium]|nr:hypothetical protein [Nannocystaceae bacterium]